MSGRGGRHLDLRRLREAVESHLPVHQPARPDLGSPSSSPPDPLALEAGQAMTLEEAAANIGRTVIYTPYDTANTWNDGAQQGVITSTNGTYAFVQYAGDQHAKATSPHMLQLAAGAG